MPVRCPPEKPRWGHIVVGNGGMRDEAGGLRTAFKPAAGRMAALLRPARRLFTGPNGRFWTYQCSLWTFYFILRNLLALFQSGVLNLMYVRMSATVCGFLITYGIWRILRREETGDLRRQIFLVTALAMAGALLNYQPYFVIQYVLNPNFDAMVAKFGFFHIYFFRFGTIFLIDVWVFLAWGGLYLGMDYYGRFQEQKLRAMEASALAQQAQLKMLRYQLNPHFMFNTLNALSALVLTRKNERAERMILGLSKFLRFSLDSDPLMKVPLHRELEVMQLYTRIERERFGNRLNFVENVDPETLNCLVPSMLLQPMIENSLKYAIIPYKDGGTITLSASLQEGQLQLRVADTGPGLNRPLNNILREPGVGISNTIARLDKIYGKDAEMKILNRQPIGLEIKIIIPAEFETSDRTEDENRQITDH